MNDRIKYISNVVRLENETKDENLLVLFASDFSGLHTIMATFRSPRLICHIEPQWLNRLDSVLVFNTWRCVIVVIVDAVSQFTLSMGHSMSVCRINRHISFAYSFFSNSFSSSIPFQLNNTIIALMARRNMCRGFYEINIKWKRLTGSPRRNHHVLTNIIDMIKLKALNKCRGYKSELVNVPSVSQKKSNESIDPMKEWKFNSIICCIYIYMNWLWIGYAVDGVPVARSRRLLGKRIQSYRRKSEMTCISFDKNLLRSAESIWIEDESSDPIDEIALTSFKTRIHEWILCHNSKCEWKETGRTCSMFWVIFFLYWRNFSVSLVHYTSAVVFRLIWFANLNIFINWLGSTAVAIQSKWMYN